MWTAFGRLIQIFAAIYCVKCIAHGSLLYAIGFLAVIVFIQWDLRANPM